MSLKSAIVIYRVDGVSGLKCLTGINAKVFLSATLKLAGHHSCPCWESVIGPQTCCPDDLSGDEERVDYQMQNRMQEVFERIFGCLPAIKTPLEQFKSSVCRLSMPELNLL